MAPPLVNEMCQHLWLLSTNSVGSGDLHPECGKLPEQQPALDVAVGELIFRLKHVNFNFNMAPI